MAESVDETPEGFWNLETRLTIVLSVLAGFVGAAAYAHSAGYFVTFMTGNTERATVGAFVGDHVMAVGAAILIAMFGLGVFVGSLGRRFWWRNHPHGASVMTTFALIGAVVSDSILERHQVGIGLLPIMFVAYGMGALNTSFVRNGEVSIPVTYVTGTVVKLVQGIERHVAGGGSVRDWLFYAVQYGSFAVGGLIGGLVSLAIDGALMLDAALIGSTIVAAYTWVADVNWVQRKAKCRTLALPVTDQFPGTR